MSLGQSIWLICENDFPLPNGKYCCATTQNLDIRAQTSVTLRIEARNLGWIRQKGKDYCSQQCATHGARLCGDCAEYQGCIDVLRAVKKAPPEPKDAGCHDWTALD